MRNLAVVTAPLPIPKASPKAPKPPPKTPSLSGKVPQFTVGQDYVRRTEIHGNYGGSEQGGISPSSFCKAIFLFTGASGHKYGYTDKFLPSGTFLFCGEGKNGPMTMSGGNKAIKDHAAMGRALHLFESLGKGMKQRYLGQFILGGIQRTRGPDEAGAIRDVTIFELQPGGMLPAAAITVTPAPAVTLPASLAARQPVTLTDLRKAAVAAAASNTGKSPGTVTPQLQRHRSDEVRDYVLARAKGNCENCTNPAPFLKPDGSPYLEGHHINRLSDDGIDHPKNMAAICPTCHCEIHFGANGVAVNDSLRLKIGKSW